MNTAKSFRVYLSHPSDSKAGSATDASDVIG